MRHSSLLDLGLWPNSVALGKTQERTIPKQEVSRDPLRLRLPRLLSFPSLTAPSLKRRSLNPKNHKIMSGVPEPDPRLESESLRRPVSAGGQQSTSLRAILKLDLHTRPKSDTEPRHRRTNTTISTATTATVLVATKPVSLGALSRADKLNSTARLRFTTTIPVKFLSLRLGAPLPWLPSATSVQFAPSPAAGGRCRFWVLEFSASGKLCQVRWDRAFG